MQAVAPVPRRTRPASPARCAAVTIRILDRRLRPAGRLDQRPARRGRHRMPGDALEQADAHGALQLAELLARRGLGEAERLRGSGDAAGLDDGEKGPQLAEARVMHAENLS